MAYEIKTRTRRLRSSEAMRTLVRENEVRVTDLIYPMFVIEGENIKNPIGSMPGIYQYSIDRMDEELDRVKQVGILSILLFGIPSHKDEQGSGAYNEQGITQRAVRHIKKKYPDKTIWLYTGYQWEDICELPIIPYLDVVVDGRFIEELQDNNLPWKGSCNQKVIDVQTTLSLGKTVLY